MAQNDFSLAMADLSDEDRVSVMEGFSLEERARIEENAAADDTERVTVSL